MAKIIRTKDPFHDSTYVCENCHHPLFTAVVICQDTANGLVGNFKWMPFKGENIPDVCPRCLEPLSLPGEIDIRINKM